MIIAGVLIKECKNGLIVIANKLIHRRPVAALNFLLAHVHATNHRLSFKYNTKVREKDIFFEMFFSGAAA